MQKELLNFSAEVIDLESSVQTVKAAPLSQQIVWNVKSASQESICLQHCWAVVVYQGDLYGHWYMNCSEVKTSRFQIVCAYVTPEVVSFIINSFVPILEMLVIVNTLV